MTEQVVTSGVLRGWPLPPPHGDKEARGRLLVIGGSRRTPGAALLAAEAALRSGAGKMQIATVESAATAMGLAIPEALVAGFPETDGEIDTAAAGELIEMGNECRTVLIGPGLGKPRRASALLAAVVPHLTCTVVIDALAMAYITDHRDGVAHLGGQAILSPNVHELAVTLGVDRGEVEADTEPYVRRLAAETGAIVVSGATRSWTSDPDGNVWRDETGAPGLATSGSGDIKAGIVAGIAARGGDPVQAAVWAAYAHGRAGERLAASVGAVGFLARDLLGEIPSVLAEISGP